MATLVNQLSAQYPQLSFIAGATFFWSPADQTVFYRDEGRVSPWPLLHEVGHALLGHTSYNSDFELLKLEAEAWQKAQTIAPDYGHAINPDHIQDCLDTYRDWLYQRSTCPVCGTTCLQQDLVLYKCFNCRAQWNVTASRFCRPYRRLAVKHALYVNNPRIATFQ